MTRKLLIFELLIVAAVAIATILLYPHFPVRVGTHWGFNGRPNGYSPRGMLVLWWPGFLAGIVALSAALPWLSPRRFEVDSFRSTYRFIMVSLFLMLAYAYAVILCAACGMHVDALRAVLGGVCLYVAVAGNVMSKVRRNFFIGVRTPWTLANERVWHATHRFAAKCFVIAGLVGLVLAIAGVRFGPIAAILVGALIPVIYSLVYYKRLERRGEL